MPRQHPDTDYLRESTQRGSEQGCCKTVDGKKSKSGVEKDLLFCGSVECFTELQRDRKKYQIN
jgi:hypothetical protein